MVTCHFVIEEKEMTILTDDVLAAIQEKYLSDAKKLFALITYLLLLVLLNYDIHRQFLQLKMLNYF